MLSFGLSLSPVSRGFVSRKFIFFLICFFEGFILDCCFLVLIGRLVSREWHSVSQVAYLLVLSTAMFRQYPINTLRDSHLHEILRVALRLGELHRVHALASVPVKERATLVHRGELR